MMMTCVVLQLMPWNVQTMADAVPVYGAAMGAVGTTTADDVMVEIPDVTNMNEKDAIAALETIVLPDGSKPEIIKAYEYSLNYGEDVVFDQNMVGKNPAKDAVQIEIVISLGEEPDESLSEATEANILSTFGLARYIRPNERPADSQFGIDWDNLPHSYEYNWDNSQLCWDQALGMWHEGIQYVTQYGTYDVHVRHKVQLYCDGTYAYLRIKFATIYGSKVNGENYNFYVDEGHGGRGGHGREQAATFQVVYPNGGGSITGNINKLAAGTHAVEVQHANGSQSGQAVIGALGYLTKYDTNMNAVLEIRIPLSAMQEQNRAINLEHIHMLEFFSPNLMYRRVRASGASTFPLVSAGVALVLIPGSTVLLKKYGKKKSKESNE